MDEKEIVTEEQKPKKKKAIRGRKHIHEITAENDIRFRAPLSYRHLRMIGWLFLAISQISIIIVFPSAVCNRPNERLLPMSHAQVAEKSLAGCTQLSTS